ncbi:SH3-domain-containing protein [Thelephora ganbajun]|uniref:SH3-domain-containing protein n=1 Tax=Thelephora ganbajun TaxID=370292 RepID=A0ACB6ZL41_THEGA|nr:SH3-domain-containing protein [Thelephora ganbajun]
MSDSTFVFHIVSQTRANIDFLQAQGYLTIEDAASIQSKLPAATVGTSERSASPPVPILQPYNPAPSHQPHPPNPPQPPQPTPRYPRARALWAYNEDERELNDLTMFVGDIIDIVEETNADWWTGRNRGKRGLFPSNYVQKLPPEASSQPYQGKSYGAPGYTNYGNHPPPQQTNPGDNAPAVNSVGLQPDEGQDKKKNKFGKFGNTVAHSAAGGLGFGAGAAVGSGIINALF